MPVAEIGDVVALEAVLRSSSTLFRCPAPSATKLPALKKWPEALRPDIEKANWPCKEDVVYPEIVTARLADEFMESCAVAVTVTA